MTRKTRRALVEVMQEVGVPITRVVALAGEAGPDKGSERYRPIRALFHELYTTTRPTVHALGHVSDEAGPGAEVASKGGVRHVP